MRGGLQRRVVVVDGVVDLRIVDIQIVKIHPWQVPADDIRQCGVSAQQNTNCLCFCSCVGDIDLSQHREYVRLVQRYWRDAFERDVHRPIVSERKFLQ